MGYYKNEQVTRLNIKPKDEVNRLNKVIDKLKEDIRELKLELLLKK